MKSTLSALLLLLAFAAFPDVASAQSALRIEGTVAFDRTGGTVLLTADRICNRSTSGRSGSVYIGLWATTGSSPVGTGFSVAETSLSQGPGDSAQLNANQCFTNIRFTTAWRDPGVSGVYFLHFYVAEFPNTATNNQLRTLSHVTFDNRITIGTPPVTPPPTVTDDHGNTLATSTPINVNVSVSGAITPAGDIDVFRFQLTSQSRVSVASTGTTDVTGQLLDASGAVLDFSDDAAPPDLNFGLAERTLPAGTYYVRVGGFNNTTTGAYAIRVTAATVAPPAAPVVTLSASPTTVNAGGSSTLTWSSTNATACQASGGWTGARPAAGSETLSNISTGVTLVLTCTGAGGSATTQVAISVTTPPPPTPPTPATSGGGGGGGGGSVTPWFLLVLLAATFLGFHGRRMPSNSDDETRR